MILCWGLYIPKFHLRNHHLFLMSVDLQTNKQIKSATVISAILLWNKQITNEMYTRLKEITHDLSNAPFSVLPAQGVLKMKWSKDGPKMAQRWPNDGPKMAQDGPKKGEIILKTWNIYSQFIFYLLQGNNYISEKSSVWTEKLPCL